MLDVLSGTAAVISDELITTISDIVNLWLVGKCPQALGEFVSSAPLTPLINPRGGTHPIVVGTIWRRLFSKVAATHIGKEMNLYLRDYQFGVGVPSMGEEIFHAVNRLLEEKKDISSMSMLLVDLSNALNLVSRTDMIREVRKQCPLSLGRLNYVTLLLLDFSTWTMCLLMRKVFSRVTP